MIREKGDGKGKLLPRTLEGTLGGEKHDFVIQPYVTAIEIEPFKIEPREHELPRFKREGRR